MALFGKKTAQVASIGRKKADPAAAETAGGTRKVRRRFVDRPIRHFDYALLFALAFLIGFGLVMIYSASSYSSEIDYGNSSGYFKKQFISVILGVIFMIFSYNFDYHKYEGKLATIIFGFSLLSMFLLLTPLGKTVNGARRWINLKFTTVQPAEFVKIGVILLTATVIIMAAKSISKRKQLFKIWGICGVVPALLVYGISSNLSSAIIILSLAFMLTFIAHPGFKPYLIIAGIITVVVLIIVIYGSTATADTASWRLNRVFVWLKPEEYAETTAYQTVQSLYAIGSGGVFGKGLGRSLQKLSYIPEAQNDMIFAIICEELGIFGAILIIGVFVLLLWRLSVIATTARDKFGTLITMGIFFQILIQVFLNIGVATNLIPNTGVTLPFISYGGSSVAILMFEMGIALNVSRYIRLDK